MNVLRCIFVLWLATLSAPAHTARQSEVAGVQSEPEAFVRTLYTQVVARHPLGIPEGADMKVFAPYLSKALRHRVDLARACLDDFVRQHPDPNLKPPFGWIESGLFSGDDEQASPRDFVLERTQPERDGSLRVYVKLTWEVPHAPIWIWRVAVVLVRENGRLAVDDVIYLKDEHRLKETRLSRYLSTGCDGSHWVGVGKHECVKPQR